MVYKRVRGWTSGRSLPTLIIFSTPTPGDWGLFQSRLYFIRNEHVCFKYFVGVSAKKEEKSCSEESNREIFRDNNHQRLYKNVKL